MPSGTKGRSARSVLYHQGRGEKKKKKQFVSFPFPRAGEQKEGEEKRGKRIAPCLLSSLQTRWIIVNPMKDKKKEKSDLRAFQAPESRKLGEQSFYKKKKPAHLHMIGKKKKGGEKFFHDWTFPLAQINSTCCGRKGRGRGKGLSEFQGDPNPLHFAFEVRQEVDGKKGEKGLEFI